MRSSKVLLVVGIALLFGCRTATSEASSSCGKTRIVKPGHAAQSGRAPLAIGDSVLYDAADLVAQEGFAVNAMICRRMDQGIALLQAQRASLPHLVVVELANNGAVSRAEIIQLLGILGPGRILALMTSRGGDVPASNLVIRNAERDDPGRVGILDWNRFSSGHPDWFAPDGLHLGSTAGVEAFAQMIAATLPYADLNPRSAPSHTPAPSTTTTAGSTGLKRARHLPSRPQRAPRPPAVKAAPTPPLSGAVDEIVVAMRSLLQAVAAGLW